MSESVAAVLFALLCGHAIADFPLQSEFIARGKNRHSASPGYDPKLHGARQTIWPYVLAAHALTHGAAVALVTGSAALGAAEAGAHFLIDFGKCERWYGIHADQALHVGCKLLWLTLLP